MILSILGVDIVEMFARSSLIGSVVVSLLVVFLLNSGSSCVDCKGWIAESSSIRLILCDLEFRYFANKMIDLIHKMTKIGMLELDFDELKKGYCNEKNLQ